MNEKIYNLESRKNTSHNRTEYRFYSLYNGMRGAWLLTKEKAVEEGELHQKIILFLHDRLPLWKDLEEKANETT